MPLRGLTILLAEPSVTRLRSALGLALSHAALGGAARLFVDSAAVSLLRAPLADAADARWQAAGFPSLAGLVEEALEAGVAITLCQGGVALANATAADFDARLDHAGMVSILATLGEDRLVAF